MLCAHYAEWAAARHFRQRFFFGPRGIKDRDTWTFNHKDHAHLVVYQGVEIIAYAHIHFLSHHRSVIRILAVDMHSHCGARVLLSCIDTWLKSLGVKSIHAASSPHNLRVYCDNGYTLMPFHDPDNRVSDPNDVAVGKVV